MFCEIKYKDGRLSIHGVEGPTNGGNCLGGCGQIDVSGDWSSFAPGWNRAKIAKFARIWDEWHLNDARAGCQHQRAEWDTDKKVALTHFKWSAEYGRLHRLAGRGELSPAEYEHFQGVAGAVSVVLGSHGPKYPEHWQIAALLEAGWIVPDNTEEKRVNWVYPHEHPDGILTKKCETCGYSYGSAWLFEPVPDDVLEWLIALPDTDKTPAWV